MAFALATFVFSPAWGRVPDRVVGPLAGGVLFPRVGAGAPYLVGAGVMAWFWCCRTPRWRSGSPAS